MEDEGNEKEKEEEEKQKKKERGKLFTQSPKSGIMDFANSVSLQNYTPYAK